MSSNGLTPEYSASVGIKKALGSAGTVVLALLPALIDPLIAYFSTDANVTQALGALDPRLLALAPVIAAGVRLIANYRKQTR